VLDCIVKAEPPSTISGWVSNSLLVLAVSCADFITVILLFKTVTVGVPAEVTNIDLIIIV